MIGQLIGKPKEGYEGTIIIDAGGVGYQVRVPVRLNDQVMARPYATLYIHTHVREDALDLYGFITKEELQLFKMLINVSGIGPKTAINILNMDASKIKQAVLESDISFFTQIPKVGTKNAQKIIIELKTKLGSLKELDLSGKTGEEVKDMVDALVGMGFSHKESLAAVKQLPKDVVQLEDKIRLALKLLRK